MAELRFRVKADYEELGKLRTEIQRLKEDLRKTGADTDPVAIKTLESQLATLTRQYEAMTKKIAETEAQYELMAKKMTEKAKEIAKAQDQLAAGPKNEVSPQQGTDAPAVDQSLAAQAKAYEDLKDEIDAIAGSKTNLIKQMLDEQNAIRLINAELKQINAKQKESGTQTQAQKERVTQLNASLLNHKEALSEVRQSLNNYVKLENAASGSMVELSQSLGRMRMVYRTLTEEERNSPFGQELLASIQQADAKIKELDATIGNHQRNVGNYGQAWNGLGNSIQQLARELPALANGPRVFFSAISNNLPILADEIKRARTEYDEMVKKGEKGTPVWKQIGASIFSWQTALTVGITLLTMYGDEIVEWGKKMIKGANSTMTAKEAVKQLNKAMVEGAKSAASQVSELKVMEAVARDVSRTDSERDKAAKKVLETMGEAITTTNLLKVKTGEYRSEIELTTKALIDQARARGAMKTIEEQTAKVLEAQAEAEARREEGVTRRDQRRAIRETEYNRSIGSDITVSGTDIFNRAVDELQKSYDTEVGKLDTLVTKFNDKFKNLFGTEGKYAAENMATGLAEEARRVTKMEVDAMNERVRHVKDMEFAVEAAKIGAIQDAEAKARAQRELEHKKQLEDIKRQKEDYVKATVEQQKAIFDAQEQQELSKNKDYKVKMFDTEAAAAKVDTSSFDVLYNQTQRKQREENLAAEKEFAKKRAQEARDMEFMASQVRISAMDEGYARTRMQMMLDHKKEMADIEKQKQEYIDKIVEREKAVFDAQEEQKAKNNAGYKKQEFNREAAAAGVDITVYTNMGTAAAKAFNKALAEEDKKWEFETKQIKISAMAEGDSKERAQRLLDNEKELYNLEQQRQAYIDAAKAAHILAEQKKMAADPTYMMKMFDEAQANADYDVIVEDTKKKQYDALADEYMSYIDKKNAIDASYEADKAELEDAYIKTGDERYKRSLEERHKAYVQALNKLEQEMGTVDYKLIFGDPSKMTSATIEKALDVARKKMAQLDKDADPETFQALSEAIERLENARDNNPFEGWDTSVMGLIQKLHEMRNIRKDIAKYEKEGNKEAKEGAEAQLQKSKNDLKKNMAGIGVDAFADGLTKAAEAMERIAEISGDPQLKQTAEILNGTANVISATATGAAAGGWIGALVGGLTSILGEAVNAIVGSEAAFAANQKAMEDYGRGLKELSLSLDEDVYDTIFGESVWTKIEHMQEKLMEAKKAYDEYVKASVKYMKVTSNIAPDGTIIETGIETGLTSIANAAIKAKGRNKKKYSGTLGTIFPDLFDEQGKLKTDKIEEAKEALKTLQSMELKNDEGVGILEEAIRLAEIAEEHTEKLKDAAKDYLGSVGASLGDSIVDSILRGEDALESFADVAGGIIEQIARDFAASWMIENYLRNFEEDMQNAFLTGDAKRVTEIVGSIVEGFPSVLEAGQNAVKKILDVTVGTNYDLYEKHAKEGSSQQASTKGYQSLSEDTGNELAGRMLAQYESNLRMEEATRSMKESVDLMAGNQIQIRDIAAESRALIADSYLELQQIRENTGAIIKPIKNLSDKIDGWDSYIKSL